MYAYYCLHKFHWTPSFFMSLDKNERAFVIASINARVEQEEEESKKVGKVRYRDGINNDFISVNRQNDGTAYEHN